MKYLKTTLAILVASSAATLTQAQVTVPEGLQAGDTYRLMFVTTTLTDAFSNDPEVYHGIVRAEVETNATLAALDTTWYAMVGVELTPGVEDGGAGRAHPRIYLGMNWLEEQLDPATGLPIAVNELSGGIWNTGGERVAAGYAEIFSGNNPTIENAITTTVEGVDFDSSNGGPRVWTGMQNIGWATNAALGAGATATRGVARDDILNGGAFNAGQDDSFELRRLYAISDVLTVPEGTGGSNWGGYTIDSSSGQDLVNTEDWMGWLDVTVGDSGWIYSYSLSGWFFIGAEPAQDSAGEWIYIIQ
jgi:hypothetical protein